MKKKIILIITFMLIIFIPTVRAEENMKVIFNTSFEEQIDINKIEEIYIMMDDINGQRYDIVLRHKDNFSHSVDNVPNGDIVINSVNVSRDYTVEYDYETSIIKNSEEETTVSILVRKTDKDPNRKKADVTYEYIAEVLGYDPTNGSTSAPTTNSNESTTTTESANNTNEDTNNNDEPIVITSPKETTTTKNEEEIEKIEQAKKEEEKQQDQKKRKNIYLLILLLIIGAIIIIGIMVGIKIANANK